MTNGANQGGSGGGHGPAKKKIKLYKEKQKKQKSRDSQNRQQQANQRIATNKPGKWIEIHVKEKLRDGKYKDLCGVSCKITVIKSGGQEGVSKTLKTGTPLGTHNPNYSAPTGEWVNVEANVAGKIRAYVPHRDVESGTFNFQII